MLWEFRKKNIYIYILYIYICTGGILKINYVTNGPPYLHIRSAKLWDESVWVLNDLIPSISGKTLKSKIDVVNLFKSLFFMGDITMIMQREVKVLYCD